MRVGVVGYSSQNFDQTTGRALLCRAFDQLSCKGSIEMVSGLTNVGIPAIAYEEATRRGWRTVGIACSQALDYDCFPVNEAVIVGESWGDESETFLDRIDMVIRIGGGQQSHQEARLAKLQGKRVIEFELPALRARHQLVTKRLWYQACRARPEKPARGCNLVVAAISTLIDDSP